MPEEFRRNKASVPSVSLNYHLREKDSSELSKSMKSQDQAVSKTRKLNPPKRWAVVFCKAVETWPSLSLGSEGWSVLVFCLAQFRWREEVVLAFSPSI